MQEVGSGIYGPGPFWLRPGRNGHNRNASGSDLTCLLGTVFRCFMGVVHRVVVVVDAVCF